MEIRTNATNENAPTVPRFTKIERQIVVEEGLYFVHHMGAPYHPAPLLRPKAEEDMTFYSQSYALIYLGDIKTEKVDHVVSVLGFKFNWMDSNHSEFLKAVINLNDSNFHKPTFKDDGKKTTFKDEMKDLDAVYDALPEEKKKKISREMFKKMGTGFANLLDENKNAEAKERKTKMMEKINKEMKQRFGENASASWGKSNDQKTKKDEL